MEDALARAGLYFDELNKIRVLDPNVAQKSSDLQEESAEFVSNIRQFQQLTDDFVKLMDVLGKQVDQEKMKAIGSRNLLQSVSKQKEEETVQLQAQIKEKQIEIERLRIQNDALVKYDEEQKEFLQQFLVDS